MSQTIPSDNNVDGGAGHDTDHNNMADVLGLYGQALGQMAGTPAGTNSQNISAIASGVSDGGYSLKANDISADLQHMGYVAATADRWTQPRYAAGVAATPSGSITVTRMIVPNNVTCSGNIDYMWITGTGGAIANSYLAVFDSTGTQISVTSDLSANGNFAGSFGTGKTSWAAGAYYIAYVVGTMWTTNYGGPEALGGAVPSNSNLMGAETAGGQPYRLMHKTGSLTAMPGSLTLGSGWSTWYMTMGFYLR